MIDEVQRGEIVEGDLDRLIERRAEAMSRANAEAATERLAAASRARRYREALLWQKLDYHSSMLASHTRTYEALIRRHKGVLRLVEAELGIEPEEIEGEDAA